MKIFRKTDMPERIYDSIDEITLYTMMNRSNALVHTITFEFRTQKRIGIALKTKESNQ